MSSGVIVVERFAPETVRAFLDAVPGLGLVVDAEGRCVACNRAMAQVFGRPEAELVGVATLSLLEPDAAQRRLERLHQARDTRAVVRWADQRGGRHFLNSVAPILDSRDDFVGAVVVSVEVTAQRQLEQERERHLEQLQHAQKMEAINRLGGGVAHDFNNVLTAILGYVELIRMTLGESPVREELDGIGGAVRRAAGLTRQLLSFARKRRDEAQAVDLDQAVRGVSQMLHRLVEDHVTIEVTPNKGGIRVWIDPTSLDQIVLNLVTNARDAMPEGGTISIRTDTRSDGELQFAVLEIADTGTGIEEELLEFVTEPFFTTKGESEGTGLGLATVRDIVNHNDGNMQIQSTPGEGTTVTVLLPLYDTRGIMARVGAPLERPSEARRTGKILVVDDDSAVRGVICKVLTDCGYQVLPASDHSAALEQFERHGRLDLVLSDIVAPGGGGPKLVNELRRQQPDLRALLMTGYPEDHQVAAHLREAILTKPFTPAQLVARLDEILAS